MDCRMFIVVQAGPVVAKGEEWRMGFLENGL
jgi:hypothetical protein